tara:strand:- start:2526 stop:3563 length:1038 start_codon:yes stop_codon:yes gene_type:complete
MYIVLRNFLFLFDAELIHEFSVKAIKFICKIPYSKMVLRNLFVINNNILERNLFGLKFKNPVGLAAGFDKNADCYNEFSNFGFGFIEIGTVTPLPQAGNPKKRIFRLTKDKSIINRLGFNNKGLDEIIKNLKKERDIIIGANIGKNVFTSNKDGHKDYLKCIQGLYDFVDYFAINISSPNTKNLREFHNKELLKPLLENLIIFNNKQSSRKPILLKISPDLKKNQLDDIISIILELKIDGIIATNTSISRDGVKSIHKNEIGGLSGKLLNKKSNEIIFYLRKKLGDNYPIIGVGGIMKPEDALEKIKCGADLVQLYTGFIYEGPTLIKRINNLILDEELNKNYEK